MCSPQHCGIFKAEQRLGVGIPKAVRAKRRSWVGGAGPVLLCGGVVVGEVQPGGGRSTGGGSRALLTGARRRKAGR